MLYIDHNIGHLHAISDRIVILELGRIVGDVNKQETSVEQLGESARGARARAVRPRGGFSLGAWYEPGP